MWPLRNVGFLPWHVGVDQSPINFGAGNMTNLMKSHGCVATTATFDCRRVPLAAANRGAFLRWARPTTPEL